MIKNADLLSYIPDFLKEYEEMRAIQETLQTEIQQVEDETKVLFDNQFILESDVRGVKHFENMLGIQPFDDDTLDNRRFNVLSAWNRYIPYTKKTVQKKLKILCGEEGYIYKFIPNRKRLVIRVSLRSRRNYSALEAMLESVVPVNVDLDISLLYNKHLFFKKFPHYRMAEYTHYQIRNEILDLYENGSVGRLTHGQLKRYTNNMIRRGDV